MGFRENCQYIRSVHDITQEQLAEQLGVSRQTVNKWEAGKAYPEIEKLVKMCDLFDCSLDELARGDLPASRTDNEASGDGIEDDSEKKAISAEAELGASQSRLLSRRCSLSPPLRCTVPIPPLQANGERPRFSRFWRPPPSPPQHR